MGSPMTPPVVYLTVDGVLGHLGFSQVFRVVEALAQRGFSYSIASTERAADLADSARVARVRDRAAAAGIRWRWAPYDERGTPAAVARNLAMLGWLAARALPRGEALVHARGYHSALVADALRRRGGVRWLFDVRGYWIDERLEEGRWFTTPRRLRAARGVEAHLFRRASAIVTLTELHAAEVRAGGHVAASTPVAVIPTCADYDEFVPADPSLDSSDARRDLGAPTGQPLVGIVGSLNRAYRPRETARLAAEILQRRADAFLVVLSGQREAWSVALVAEGISPERFKVVSVPHDRMPAVLRELSWALMLLEPETRAKLGAMPTKLAEFFASGVRVCAHGCNREVTGWVERAGGGYVLGDLSDGSVSAAAVEVAARLGEGPNLEARERTVGHFGLAAGVERYERVLRGMGEGARA